MTILATPLQPVLALYATVGQTLQAMEGAAAPGSVPNSGAPGLLSQPAVQQYKPVPLVPPEALTGMVVDCGEGSTSVVPVVDGYVVGHRGVDGLAEVPGFVSCAFGTATPMRPHARKCADTRMPRPYSSTGAQWRAAHAPGRQGHHGHGAAVAQVGPPGYNTRARIQHVRRTPTWQRPRPSCLGD